MRCSSTSPSPLHCLGLHVTAVPSHLPLWHASSRKPARAAVLHGSTAASTAAEAQHREPPAKQVAMEAAVEPPMFDTMLSRLQHWVGQFGNCYVPRSAPEPEAPALAAWLKHVRAARRAGKLSQQQLTDLEQLNFNWKNNVLDATWHHQYHLLRRWAAAHGSPQQLLQQPPDAPPPTSQQQQAQGRAHSSPPLDSSLEQEQAATRDQESQQAATRHSSSSSAGGGGDVSSSSSSSSGASSVGVLGPKEEYDLATWLARQGELYRQMKLTPLKVQLLKAAGVQLRRQAGVVRHNLHPLLKGADPATTHSRRVIKVSAATPQGRAAVARLVAQYRAAEQQQQQQQQQQQLEDGEDAGASQAHSQQLQQQELPAGGCVPVQDASAAAGSVLDSSTTTSSPSSSSRTTSTADTTSSPSNPNPSSSSASSSASSSPAAPARPLSCQQVLDPQQQPHPDLAFMLLLSRLQAWHSRYGTSAVPPSAAWEQPALVTWVTGLKEQAALHQAHLAHQHQLQHKRQQQVAGGGEDSRADDGGAAGDAGDSAAPHPLAAAAAAAALPAADGAAGCMLLQPWQYAELSAVPFEWQPDPALLTWHHQYQQLRAFKTAHHHLTLPPGELADWLQQQLAGEAALTSKQQQLLEKLMGQYAGAQQQQQQGSRARPGYQPPELVYAGPHPVTGHATFKKPRRRKSPPAQKQPAAAAAG